ncbi:MAG: asparagine synthase (glutamine-hydrolyzing) [Planctomycetes bacterium]|nr:asparagine synthase (glutamine-hydrolyzing) [Planctomycetota bacterium]
MCGIAGIAGPGAERHEGPLRAMVAALRHRGPDEEGFLLLPGCALGHARLSIVDLGTGRQPMVGPGGRGAVVFNGEIHGFRRLREALAPRPFATSSDTEVILALHERDGEEAPASLPGMFAYAHWDAGSSTLTAARDRFGEKPFFHARGPDGLLLFASEIGALLASGLIRPGLRRASLSGYLQRGYVHPRTTLFEGVETLPPAHRLSFRAGEVRVDRYWSLPPPAGEVDPDEAAGRFRDLLGAAVERQLVADVPLGALLSGGLDSTTVVATAARLAPGLRTFSFGIEGAGDELPLARETARMHGTDHLEVRDVSLDVPALLRRTAALLDEPLADTSVIPTFVVSGLAREHVKVALTGDGADELLGGYWYLPPLRDMEEAPAETAWRWILARALARVAPGAAKGRAARRVRGLEMRRSHGTLREARAGRALRLPAEDLARLGLPPADPAPDLGPGTLDDVLRDDIEDQLPGCFLVKTDRTAMAHGLELRAPFLDVELASFLVSLPVSLKVLPGEAKVLLRRACSGLWPESVRTRPKQGFGAPVDLWLRRPDVEALRREVLGDPGAALFRLLPREEVERSAARGPLAAWTLLVLALWLEARGR